VFAVSCYNKIVSPRSSGRVVHLAGRPETYGFAGDGGPALQALFGQAWPLVVGQKGDLYVGDRGSQRVRRLHASGFNIAAGLVHAPSRNGSEVYEFDLEGRH